jgi:Tol biopolymer transport system component
MKIKFSRAICLLVLSAMMQGGCASSSRSAGAPTVVDVFWDTYLFTNVTRLSEDREVKSWARVSPDGTKMLYCEENKQSRNAQRNIMLLRDVSVPAKTMLISDTDAYAPSWYENSTNYLFVAMEGKVGRIVRSAITGGGKTYINRNPIGTADTNPSIRNGVILCDTVISGRRQLISMRDNRLEVNKQVTQLFSEIGSRRDLPSYSSDGKYIIF